jgi:hypothetical protein
VSIPDADFTEPAQALVNIFGASKETGVVEGFAAVLWERETFDQMPAIAVGIPVFRRRDLDQAESQLGALDYFFDYPVSLYVDLENALRDQQKMVDGLQAIAVAIDEDPGLNGTVFDSAISEGTPFIEEGRRRPLAGYQITVTTQKLVQPA